MFAVEGIIILCIINQSIDQCVVTCAVVQAGMYYYEVSCHDQGLCRIGWSTSQAALDLGKLFFSQHNQLKIIIRIYFA